jgi:hypothetical protein
MTSPERSFGDLAAVMNDLADRLGEDDKPLLARIYDLFDSIYLTATSRSTRAISLPDPLPAEAEEGGVPDPVPVVVLGISGNYAYVVSRDGGSWWSPVTQLRYKFPPDGPYRLLFGWAEKGKS